MFSVTHFKTKIHLINLNKSSTSHFTKVSLHVFTYLHIELAFPFMEEQKSTAEKVAEGGAIIVLSRLLHFHNRWRPKSKLNLD